MTFYKHIKLLGIVEILGLSLFLLNPFGLNLIIGLVLVPVIFFNGQFIKNNIDAKFIILILLSVTYALFYFFTPHRSIQLMLAYTFFPSAFYFLGKKIAWRCQGSTDVLFLLLITVGVIFSLIPLISVGIDIIEGGFGQFNRSLPLIWDDRKITATIMSAYFTLNMCIPGILMVREKKFKLAFNIVALIFFLLSLVCVLRLGSRTQIVVALITIFCSLLYMIPRQSSKRNFIMLGIFTGILIVLISNVNFDLSEDWLSAFAGRMEKGGADDIASGGGRTSRWLKSLENLFQKPLGWRVEEFGHAHNLWLDVLRVSGIIPFILLIIFTVQSFFTVRKAIGKNKAGIQFNNQILVYSLAFFLLFMVEPIYDGIFEMFVFFCLFIGTISKYHSIQPDNH